MLNQDLSARRMKAIPRGVVSAFPIYAARAENAEIWDVEGRRFIDFAGGIAVLNVGHRHPRIMDAVSAQLDRFTHTAFQVCPYEAYVSLAERLNAMAPFLGDAKTIFFTTGAEATENAVKIARAATGRPGVIAFTGGFHGRTLLASAMTGKVQPYKVGFGPFPSEIYHLPFPSESTGISLEETERALAALFASDTEAGRIAAVIIEPVQGEGGFHVAPPALFRMLDGLRRRNGVLLVADEIQSGFARTGRMFGIEHSGVEPDLVTVAKSLGGGMPIAGVIGRAEIMDAVAPGGLGGTYAGPPLACVAAHAVLDIIEQEGLLERALRIGELIRSRVTAFRKRSDITRISAVRGLGSMLAFDVLGADGAHDGPAAKAICQRACEKGLIVLNCGQSGQAIRLLVPLTASDALVTEGLDILESALIRQPDHGGQETRARNAAK